MKQSSFGSKVKGNREKRKAEESNYGYLNLPKDIDVFKPREGMVKLDFLPYEVTSDNHPDKDAKREIAVKGSLWYKLPFKAHSNIGPNNETVVCPTTFGKPCPICEYRKKLANQGVEYDELKKLDTTRRNLYVVYPGKDDKKLDPKPYIWDVSNFLFQKLLDEELDYHDEYAAFPEQDETGYTLELRFEEKTFNKNKFYQTNRIDFRERKKGIPESVLELVPDLDKVLVIHTYDELETLMFNLEEPEPKEEVDDEPVRKKRQNDDDDDDEPKRKKRQDDDDEEEEKPKLSLTRQAKKAEPEDRCKACGGTGVSSKGGECKPCKGTGVIVNDDDDDDDDDDYEPKKKNPYDKQGPRTGKESPKEKSYKKDDDDDDEEPVRKKKPTEDDDEPKKGKCPYGHTFGEDNDKFPKDCNKCKLWDDCADESE